MTTRSKVEARAPQTIAEEWLELLEIARADWRNLALFFLFPAAAMLLHPLWTLGMFKRCFLFQLRLLAWALEKVGRGCLFVLKLVGRGCLFVLLMPYRCVRFLLRLPSRFASVWRSELAKTKARVNAGAGARARARARPKARREDDDSSEKSFNRGLIGAIIGFVIGGEIADSMFDD